ncbi:MAG: helix-turn-helix domain-containing protein [Lactobacillales bacterium]|jgi:transcriptional regulator with XRE-family HTH domain|nr:helix-turn-helix domain-containing protein [Lactobacillales bacterium]
MFKYPNLGGRFQLFRKTAAYSQVKIVEQLNKRGITISNSDISRFENKNTPITTEKLLAMLYVLNYSVTDFFYDENVTQVARLLEKVQGAIAAGDFDKERVYAESDVEIFSTHQMKITNAMVDCIYANHAGKKVPTIARNLLNKFFFKKRDYIRMQYVILCNCVNALDIYTLDDQINYLCAYLQENEDLPRDVKHLIVQAVLNMVLAKMSLKDSSGVFDVLDLLIVHINNNDFETLMKLWIIRGVTQLESSLFAKANETFDSIKNTLNNLGRYSMTAEYEALIDEANKNYLYKKPTNYAGWLTVYIPN